MSPIALVFGDIAEGVNAYMKPSPPACVRLRSLTLFRDHMNSLFAGHLLPMISENALTSLSLWCIVTDEQMDLRNAGKLIRHAHRTLEHLSLKLSSSLDDEGTQEIARTGLNLDLCTSLASFDLNLSYTRTFLRLFVRTLFKELFSRRPEHIRTLQFIVFRVDSLDDITGLDQTLHSSMPPGSSTRVRLAWGGFGPARAVTPEERDAFVEAMPLLRDRGRLYFHPDGDSNLSIPWNACAEVHGCR
ncbi:uncharacterized protein PHACADRAFT_209539 [Phanerochaete carnosa HHB-10118-sp]|uniref:Uncharacterized protein n=1 Tax=Phanerochaete carnosa (strain HHB-10118-sp) TaxID=650164 RepID=K5WAN7_PHACS|nr:uncharacterized protein PHACADRAFT_209539 [Phanerochaete carnosa HHB-10118-sp]EKM56044.1 hypothetical protein PHACADRAFT_209539 [Phanerochaete carnosa HHB-10118-sp]